MIGTVGVAWQRTPTPTGKGEKILLAGPASLQFVFDQFRYTGVRLVAGKQPAIDKHGRRSCDASPGSFGDVLCYGIRSLAGIEAGIESGGIQLHILSPPF